MIIIFVAMILLTRDVVIASIVLAVFSMLLVFIIDFPIAGYFAKIKWNFKWKTTKELIIACVALFFVYIHNAPKYALTGLGGDNKEILTDFNALFMPVFVVDLFAGFTMRMWLTKMTVFHNDGDYKS